MSLSLGAEIGIAVAIVCIGILGSAMVAFYHFRRRRRMQEASGLKEDMIPRGRLMTEKPLPPRPRSSSGESQRSEEPILQAVFDGFPGSMGYDDVRSLYSNANLSTNLNSPTLPHSPSFPSSYNNGGASLYSSENRERNELSVARLHSAPLPSHVVSYGPNPVTPTLVHRTSTTSAQTVESVPVPVPVSTDTRKDVLPMPTLSSMPSYASFSTYDYPDYHMPVPARPPVTIKQTAPIIVSYGPNKVTPTPTVTTATVPPDDAIVNRMKKLAAIPARPPPVVPIMPAVTPVSVPVPVPMPIPERQFSFDDEFDQFDVGSGTMAPLPPYASTADFDAMKSGAIRKLAEPQAEAELPPTKDGFYHFGADITEYELPGSSVSVESGGPASSSHRHRIGLGGGDIDEQKFLLSDVEIAKLRELKKAKAAQNRAGSPINIEELRG